MRRYLRHPQCLLLLALVCISLSNAQGQSDGNPGQGGGPPDGNPGQGGGQDDPITTAATTTEEVDPCDSVPCMNGATCSKINGTTYTCTCAEGYTGQQCETDIDDCVNGSCVNGGTCEDIGVGQVRCNCPPQWTGNTCSDDLDECDVGTDMCHEYANCTNQIGDHLCKCHAGYSGDGVNCTFDDPCAGDPCGQYGVCFTTTFNFTCECIRGWEGVDCSQEIDGCAKLTCDAAWGQCVRTGPGLYECQCKKGSSGNGTHCFEEVLFDPITGNHTFYGPTDTIAVDVVGGIPVLGKIFDRFYVRLLTSHLYKLVK